MKIGWRIWLLIAILLLSILAIKPSFETGVSVSSVTKNTSVFDSGLRAGETIKTVNGQPVKSIADYTILTNSYNTSEEKRIDITTNKDTYTFLTRGVPNISVSAIPSTRIKTGLDLSGGARALVKPDVKINDAQLQDLVDISRNRFNVYGLQDVQVSGVTDLDGNKFMLVEVAGATPTDLEQLIGQQGKFEGRIGNITVFSSERGDIADVCKNDASCAGVRQCDPSQDGYVCTFQFVVYLTEKAAERHAAVTGNISLDETGKYLSQKIDLLVDNETVSSLLIGVDLRGKVTTQIQVQGSGKGKTQPDALTDAKAQMANLQTILKTGSLPYKLVIVKLDTISPNLGNDFIRLLFIAGGLSMLAVGLIVLVRYRKIKASLALLFTSFSELLIILGVAAFIRWNLDLPSIAGILATIGTGVDAQIMIMDEAERGKELSIKERMKRALFVIVTAYATAVVSLIPLWWAGAGLFKGFALTTIIGITAGVLITRPAFAEMIKRMKE